eukprot:9503817-Pyramimonas_sp.AAC.4
MKLNEDSQNKLMMRVLRVNFSGPMIAIAMLACWVGKLLILKPDVDSWVATVFYSVMWVLCAYLLWYFVDISLDYTKVRALGANLFVPQEHDHLLGNDQP